MGTPGEIAARIPVPALIIAAWVAGGVYSLLGSFAMAELGAMIPRSGFSKPTSKFSSEVFPAPDRPSTAVTPGWIVTQISRGHTNNSFHWGREP